MAAPSAATDSSAVRIGVDTQELNLDIAVTYEFKRAS
jgi:hypothetical protein